MTTLKTVIFVITCNVKNGKSTEEELGELSPPINVVAEISVSPL